MENYQLKFQINDIVETTEEFGNRRFTILGITDVGYKAVARNSKIYNLEDSQISKKVGTSKKEQEDTFDIKTYCLMQSKEFPQESEAWLFLSKLTPGQIFGVVHRKYLFDAEFVGINFKKPLYPIRAKIKGKMYDFKLTSVLKSDLQ